MPYDPKFWEVPVDPGDLDGLPGVSFNAPAVSTPAAAAERAAALAVLAELVNTRLTDRQQRLVQLYFYEGRTQAEICEELGVSQQAVSRQLFGVLRQGKRVGGAIHRLRKLCQEVGIDPEKWV